MGLTERHWFENEDVPENYEWDLENDLEVPKEQVAVPVIQREIMHMLFWCCGSCGVAITNGDRFCRNCGKVLKWK